MSKIGSGSNSRRIGSEAPRDGASRGDAQASSLDSPRVEDDSNGEPLEAVLEELNSLVGLETAKSQVQKLIATHKANIVRQEHGHTSVPIGLHLAFLGPPGTGKTTVARLIARIYRAIGLLPRGHLVEADRSSLVAGFIGQTAIKVQEVVEAADGGVLFIDEAYSLASDSGSGFGDEAIATLVKEMENRRHSMAVVIAGYEQSITDLLKSNQGLKSRFQRSLVFGDYSQDELNEIFVRLSKSHQIDLTPEVAKAVRAHIESAKTSGDAGNARYVRNLFEGMFTSMSERANSNSIVELHEVTQFSVNDVPPAEGGTSNFGFLRA